MEDRLKGLEPIQEQEAHTFGQPDPHRPPDGCSGISAYIPRPWLRAYKTQLKAEGITIAEDLNRHVVARVMRGSLSVWDIQRKTAEGGD